MIAPEGKIILIPALCIFIVCLWCYVSYPSYLLKWSNYFFSLLILFIMFFFREPQRIIPDVDGFLSPADGKVVQIVNIDDPDIGEANQISIFLSIFNVHSQLVPFSAKVINKKYNSPTLFLYGGETTVELGDVYGLGGRNQELILACLHYLKKENISYPWAIMSIATDGVDYIEKSAGGIISNDSIDFLKEKNIDTLSSLNSHDSYNVLSMINSNIYTEGSTGTNVCDIVMCLI